MITQDWDVEQKERYIAMIRDFLEWSETRVSSFFQDWINDAATLEDLEWITSHIHVAQELGRLTEEEELSLIVSAQLREIIR